MLDLHKKKILNSLRMDSRRNLVEIAGEFGLALWKVRDANKELDSRFVGRYTVLLDFDKIGCNLRMFFILKPRMGSIYELERFLKRARNINNLHLVDDYCTYFFEAVFFSNKGLNKFILELNKFDFNEKKQMFISEEIKKEGFLLL